MSESVRVRLARLPLEEFGDWYVWTDQFDPEDGEFALGTWYKDDGNEGARDHAAHLRSTLVRLLRESRRSDHPEATDEARAVLARARGEAGDE